MLCHSALIYKIRQALDLCLCHWKIQVRKGSKREKYKFCREEKSQKSRKEKLQKSRKEFQERKVQFKFCRGNSSAEKKNSKNPDGNEAKRAGLINRAEQKRRNGVK